MKKVWVPQLIAIFVLLWALNSGNPYKYYIMLRWVCCGIFAFLSLKAFKIDRQLWAWILGLTAAVYNPIIPVHLKRELWSLVNVVTIGIAVASVFSLKFERYDAQTFLTNGSNEALGHKNSQSKENPGLKRKIRSIIIVTFFLGLFAIVGLGFIWFFDQFEEYKLIFRFSGLFLFWLVCICATLFYNSDWKNFSFKQNWTELVGRMFGVAVWTVIIYLAAFYGIGLDE
jgi:hypothetical protein